MNTLKVSKSVASLTVGVGVMKIVSNVVDACVPVNPGLEKLVVICGKLGLASLAAEVTMKHFEDKFDEVFEWLTKNVSN